MDLIRSRRGLMSKIAAGLGVTRAAVAMWREVPVARLDAVARISGIPARKLRPDLAAAFAPASAPCPCERT